MSRQKDVDGSGDGRGNRYDAYRNPEAGRNKRDVWTVNSEPTPEAHFATFPQRLIEPCILAGTSERGECVRCGKNWVRVVDRALRITEGRRELRDSGRVHLSGGQRSGKVPGSNTRGYPTYDDKTTGWRPQCACSRMCDDPACNCGQVHHVPTRPNIVLDPFLGSGTVGKVSERFGRRWVGLDLSTEYHKIAKRRTAQMGLRL